jgi:hypothetical protein
LIEKYNNKLHIDLSKNSCDIGSDESSEGVFEEVISFFDIFFGDDVLKKWAIVSYIGKYR